MDIRAVTSQGLPAHTLSKQDCLEWLGAVETEGVSKLNQKLIRKRNKAKDKHL